MPEPIIASSPTWIDLLIKGGAFAAIIVGAPFALYRHYRARPYAPRIKVGLVGQLLKADGQAYLQIEVRLENIGQSKVEIIQDGSVAEIFAFFNTPEPRSLMVSRKLYDLDVLVGHDGIESGETIEDCLLVKVPHEGILSFYINVVVSSLDIEWFQNIMVNCILKPEQGNSS